MFEKFRRKNANEDNSQQVNNAVNQQGDTVYTWDNLAQDANLQAEQQRQKEAHQNFQRDKVAMALLVGNPDVVGQSQVNLRDDDRQAVIERIANGQITADDENAILANIAAPVQLKGINEVASTIAQNSHERKILSWTSGLSIDRFDSSYIDSFMARYPTPMDFEGVKGDFLNMIRQNNTDAKYQQYEADMDQFCRDIYGKRQEYYERVQELNGAAEEYREAQRDRAALNAHERERQFNNPFTDMGGSILSKANLRGELNGKPSGDSAYIDNNGFMAVFDGVGSSVDDAAASNACKSALPDYLSQIDFGTFQGRQELVHRLSEHVPAEDATTCVITHTEKNPDGTATLNYVAVGDSRLYIIRNGQAYQITHDDSVTEEMLNNQGITDYRRRKQLLLHGITNSLSKNFHGANPENNGSVMLYPGDKIMLCSDGITGDTPDHMLDAEDRANGKQADVMSNEEIVRIVNGSDSCQAAAQNLINNAKKFDDRTALVAAI